MFDFWLFTLVVFVVCLIVLCYVVSWVAWFASWFSCFLGGLVTGWCSECFCGRLRWLCGDLCCLFVILCLGEFMFGGFALDLCGF